MNSWQWQRSRHRRSLGNDVFLGKAMIATVLRDLLVLKSRNDNDIATNTSSEMISKTPFDYLMQQLEREGDKGTEISRHLVRSIGISNGTLLDMTCKKVAEFNGILTLTGALLIIADKYGIKMDGIA